MTTTFVTTISGVPSPLVFLGTASQAVFTGPITLPSGQSTYRFGAYKGGQLTISTTLSSGSVQIGDAFTTGSSIMPQKKNPDMAELIRGKSGRVYGDLVALLTVMKGLPLAYNRDMQEDKEPLFDAAKTTADSLEIAALMLDATRFSAARFEDDWRSDLLLATELADYLVRKGMPFREAHGVVGGIVRSCVERRRSLGSLALTEYRKHSTLFARDLYGWISPKESVRRKRSAGSTSPREVRAAIASWKRLLRP